MLSAESEVIFSAFGMGWTDSNSSQDGIPSVSCIVR
jgi:hypothetical protein